MSNASATPGANRVVKAGSDGKVAVGWLATGDLAGTENQVTVTGGEDAILGAGVTLSLPQNLHTGATPAFAGVNPPSDDGGSLGTASLRWSALHALLASVATARGGAEASGNLTLQSTSHATRGSILFGSSAYDEANNRLGLGTTSPTAALDINSDALRLRTAKTPASASATGNPGDICWDADYIYVCVATNTWKRTAITTW